MKAVFVCLIVAILFGLVLAEHDHKHHHGENPQSMESCRACEIFVASAAQIGLEAAIKALPEHCQMIAQLLTEDSTDLSDVCVSGLGQCLCGSVSGEESSSSSSSDYDDSSSSSSSWDWSFSSSSSWEGWSFYSGSSFGAGFLVFLVLVCMFSTLCALVFLRFLFLCLCRRKCTRSTDVVAVPLNVNVNEYEYHSAPQIELESGLYPALATSENQMPAPMPVPLHIDGTPVPCYYVPAHMTVPPEGWAFATLPPQQQN